MSKNIVILNSRQGLLPCRNSNWVKNTIEATKWVKENNFILLSSVGMSSWELVTALASIYKIRLKLFIPVKSNQNIERLIDFYADQYELERKLVEFVPVNLLFEDISNQKLMKERDQNILEHADIIIPVSLRKKSNWYNHLKEKIPYSNLNNNFVTTYETKKLKQAYQIKKEDFNPALKNLDHRYYFHFTRQSIRRWPDENQLTYYKAILDTDEYPRSAMATLDKIITEKKIIASSKNIPGKTEVVSFTNSEPEAMVKLIRWRARYHQMSFEPYAVGIKKNYALEKGLVPVIYYKLEDNNIITAENKWLYQSCGKVTDWSDEKEYRHLGDYNFADIPSDKLIVITRFKDEAEQLQKKTGIKSLPFTIY